MIEGGVIDADRAVDARGAASSNPHLRMEKGAIAKIVYRMAEDANVQIVYRFKSMARDANAQIVHQHRRRSFS